MVRDPEESLEQNISIYHNCHKSVAQYNYVCSQCIWFYSLMLRMYIWKVFLIYIFCFCIKVMI